MKISDSDIKKICSDSVFRSGADYCADGRVHIRVRGENRIVAAVDAGQTYNVHIGFDENGNISETYCTCPYYQTMSANCKHIAAVLKARQKELASGDASFDTNDRVAGALCKAFEQQKIKKQPLHIGFIFNRLPPPVQLFGGNHAGRLSRADFGNRGISRSIYIGRKF